MNTLSGPTNGEPRRCVHGMSEVGADASEEVVNQAGVNRNGDHEARPTVRRIGPSQCSALWRCRCRKMRKKEVGALQRKRLHDLRKIWPIRGSPP